MLSAHSHLHSLWWIQHTAVLQFCDSPTRFCLFCLSPISTVFSPESGLDYIPPSQAIPLQVSCFFLCNLFLVFLFLVFTCIFYDCHLISMDKLVEMISNNLTYRSKTEQMGAVQMEMVTLPGTHMRTWYFNISFISTTKLWSILAIVVFLWDWLFIPYQSHVKDNILGNVNGIFLHFLPICLSGKRPLGQSGTAQGGATEAKPWAGAEQVQIFSIFSTFLMFFSIFSNVFEYIFQYFQMSSISFLIFSNVSSIFSKIQFSSTSKIFH